MITKCIITKNTVCLEWFIDQKGVYELCLTFGDYSLELCVVRKKINSDVWLVEAIHEEMSKWDDHEFPSLELAQHQMTAAALDAFGLEKDCEGKDALAAYMNKERKD